MFINDRDVSKILFLFVSYIVISCNYLTQVLPCQTQYFFKNKVVYYYL